MNNRVLLLDFMLSASWQKKLYGSLSFFISLAIVGLGAPDRIALLPLTSYIGGYAAIFFLASRCNSLLQRSLILFFWMLGVQLMGLNWLATTHYHGQGILAVYFTLAAGFGFQFLLLGLFLPRAGKTLTPSTIICMAGFWTIMEWSRLFLLCGFPFNSVGLVLMATQCSLQFATVAGIYGMTFWVILSALFGVRAWNRGEGRDYCTWIILLMLPFIYGFFHERYHNVARVGSPVVHVALIQSGLASEEKWSMGGREECYIPRLKQWQRMFRFLEESGREKLDILVLPEVAISGEAYNASFPYQEVIDTLFYRLDLLPKLEAPLAEERDDIWYVSNAWIAQSLANLYNTEVVIGLLDYDAESNNSYNSAFHFLPFQGVASNRYDKRILVPLTEYLPLEMLRSFVRSFGINAFFTPGNEAKIFKGAIPFATSICMEEVFSNVIREGRLKGAQMFINVTNDGWFPASRLPQEHFNLGRMRAVENGVPLLRSCNTGVSAAVESNGYIVREMAERNPRGDRLSGVIIAQVNSYVYKTFFSKTGNGLIILLSFIACLYFFWRKPYISR